jgi:mono/diheme cytochrome c family protein
MTQQHTASRRTISARTWIIIGFFTGLVGLIAFNLWRNPTITSANPLNIRAVSLGRTVYTARCASCHGANLEGAPNWQTPVPTGGMPAPPHDPTGHTWHHSDESLFTTVKYGGQATSPSDYKSNMPALGSVLSDEEIYAVLAYIKSTWPTEIQEAQRQGHQ